MYLLFMIKPVTVAGVYSFSCIGCITFYCTAFPECFAVVAGVTIIAYNKEANQSSDNFK